MCREPKGWTVRPLKVARELGSERRETDQLHGRVAKSETDKASKREAALKISSPSRQVRPLVDHKVDMRGVQARQRV